MRTALFCLLSLMMSVSQAQSAREPGDVEITLLGFSKHLEEAPKGREWHETNEGFGLRRFVRPLFGLETFVAANFVNENSTGGPTIAFGGGVQHPIVRYADTELLVGLNADLWGYRNSWEQKTYVFPALYPAVGIRRGRLAGTVAFFPKISYEEKRAYPALFIGGHILFR